MIPHLVQLLMSIREDENNIMSKLHNVIPGNKSNVETNKNRQNLLINRNCVSIVYFKN